MSNITLNKPEVLVHADPTPCKARASQSTRNDVPNVNNIVDTNITQKPANIGTV